MALNRPAAVLGRMPRVRVLVAGDLMLDHFIWGRVERISRWRLRVLARMSHAAPMAG